MNNKQAIETFAKNFVNKQFRTRFVHEAIKKPTDLHRRICHEIDKVFDDKYKSVKHSFNKNEACLFLGWFDELKPLQWEEAQEKIADNGGGYLVINTKGTKFYAETEAYPPEIYAGSS